jgi:hypothetical protein
VIAVTHERKGDDAPREGGVDQEVLPERLPGPYRMPASELPDRRRGEAAGPGDGLRRPIDPRALGHGIGGAQASNGNAAAAFADVAATIRAASTPRTVASISATAKTFAGAFGCPR